MPLRWRLLARVSLLWRWEFWPRQVFYAPMVPVWAVIALRHRTLTAWTAANPGVDALLDRKSPVLAQLPESSTPVFVLVSAGPVDERVAALQTEVEAGRLSFPLILKPDIGERGAGVRLVRGVEQARGVLARQHSDMLAQTYHPGPVESGIAYARHPDAERGRIFSVTLKSFPTLVGDGERTLRELVWADARLRMQASVLLNRLSGPTGAGADRIPGVGEVVTLAVAGNHCQGTMFTDGAGVITPELTAAVERIARSIGGGSGLCLGRMDVRCASMDDLRAGRGLCVLEVNGVLGESTNIYDPRRSLLAAYATLARQWSLACRFGLANVRAGRARPLGLRELLRAVFAHTGREDAATPSD